MKITAAHRKEINAVARRTAHGPLHHVEVAWRHCRCPGKPHGRRDEINLLFLGNCKDHDLSDLVRLAELDYEIEEHDRGKVVLDLYVYDRVFYGRAQEASLSHNLTAVFKDGRLLSVTE